MYLYEMRFKYLDSLNEDWHVGQVVVYDSFTEEGQKLANAVSKCQDEDDKELNALLEPLEVTDSDIIFYYDINDSGNEMSKWSNFPLEIQQSMDIIIKDIDYITGE